MKLNLDQIHKLNGGTDSLWRLVLWSGPHRPPVKLSTIKTLPKNDDDIKRIHWFITLDIKNASIVHISCMSSGLVDLLNKLEIIHVPKLKLS